MPKLVTVIITVYNGDKFIDRCVESVLSQQNFDINELEILIINDGSTDGSLKKINTYKSQFPKIFTVINQKNKGAANARNHGISLAKGDFLTIVDQDDWLDSNFLSQFIEALEEDTDVVQGGFSLVSENKQIIKQIFPTETEFGKFLAIPAWAKLYRTEFLRSNKINFFENNIGEDSIFTVDVIRKCRKYKTIRYAGYNNFFENLENVTNGLHKGLSPQVNFVGLLNRLKQTLDSQNSIYEYNLIRTFCYYLLSYGKYATPDRFREVYLEIFKWIKENKIYIYKNRYVWFAPSGELISARLGIKIILLVEVFRLIKPFSKIYAKGKN
ncbi:MAG: glycosyltransferase [Candidatus Nanogingivalis sp.]